MFTRSIIRRAPAITPLTETVPASQVNTVLGCKAMAGLWAWAGVFGLYCFVVRPNPEAGVTYIVAKNVMGAGSNKGAGKLEPLFVRP